MRLILVPGHGVCRADCARDSFENVAFRCVVFGAADVGADQVPDAALERAEREEAELLQKLRPATIPQLLGPSELRAKRDPFGRGHPYAAELSCVLAELGVKSASD